MDWKEDADEDAGRLLLVVPRGDVAHGSADGDGPDVEASHYLTHPVPVVEGVFAPVLANVCLKGQQ